MRKRILLLALLSALELILSGVGEKVPQAQGFVVSAEQFSAIAQAQLETIHYMAHIFRLKRGAYPKSLAELKESPYYVIDLVNLYTGEPIQQIGFIPEPEDFATDEVLPGGMRIPSLPRAEDAGSDDGPPTDEGAGAPASPPSEDEETPSPLPAPAGGRRIEPTSVPMPTPGNLLYWTEGRSLQLVIFSDSGTWKELWMARPYSYQADLLKTTESVRPQSDFLVAEVAMHLERMLPGMIGRYLFLTSEASQSPRELAEQLPQRFAQYASTLGMVYTNPLKSRPLMPARYYSPGDVAIAPWLPQHPQLLYFLQGYRARSLDELIDADTLRAHARDIARRDHIIKARIARTGD
ncbi:MAG: hypothetical protein B1H03_01830 [Planctomycetales bacterium 4484_113]|nr:MAG: hypothetical protein B1H03_01830 [Planctomycetales bacterium 4484_113]